jgi:hypothetical protein
MIRYKEKVAEENLGADKTSITVTVARPKDTKAPETERRRKEITVGTERRERQTVENNRLI